MAENRDSYFVNLLVTTDLKQRPTVVFIIVITHGKLSELLVCLSVDSNIIIFSKKRCAVQTNCFEVDVDLQS